MNLLLVLRILTALTNVALTAALAVLVLKAERGLAADVRTVWIATAIIQFILTFDFVAAEVLAFGYARSGESAVIGAVYRTFYYYGYLVNAVVVAVLPGILLRVLSADARVVRAGGLLLMAVGGVALWAWSHGAVRDFAVLLGWTRVLTFLGLIGYLGFWTFVALEIVRGLDRYLALFLVVRTLYELVKPIQEVFFQSAGTDGSAAIWPLHQFLQFAMAAGMLAIVVLLDRALRRGTVVVPWRVAERA